MAVRLRNTTKQQQVLQARLRAIQHSIQHSTRELQYRQRCRDVSHLLRGNLQLETTDTRGAAGGVRSETSPAEAAAVAVETGAEELAEGCSKEGVEGAMTDAPVAERKASAEGESTDRLTRSSTAVGGLTGWLSAAGELQQERCLEQR